MRASKLEEDAPKRPSLCEFDRRDRASGAIRRSSHRVSSRNASSAAPSIGCATDPFKAYLAMLMVIGSELLAHCLTTAPGHSHPPAAGHVRKRVGQVWVFLFSGSIPI